MKSNFLLIAIFIIFTCFEAQAVTKTVISTGNWSNDNIWSPVGRPSATDDVVIINGYTLNVDGYYTIKSVTVQSGTLGNVSSAHQLTITESLTGVGLFNCNIVLNGTATATIDGFSRCLGFTINAGATLNINSQNGTSSVDGTITNNGTINIANGHMLEPYNSVFGTLNNHGQLNYGPGSSYSSININFTNHTSGSLTLNSGGLIFRRALVSSGVINIGSGAELVLKRLNSSLNAGGTLTGDGTLNIDVTNPNPVTINQSYSPLSVKLIMTTGKLLGGPLTLNNALEWLGGTIELPMTLNSPNNQFNSISKTLTAPMVNYGTINGTGNSSVVLAAAFTNNGTFNIDQFSLIDHLSGGSFVNNGTLLRNANTTVQIRTNVTNSASGTFNLNAGTTVFTNKYTTEGNCSIAAGTIVSFNDLAINAGTFSCSGNVTLTGGNSSSVNIPVNWNGPFTYNAVNALGSINGTGTQTFNNTLDWQRGKFGTLVILSATATATLTNSTHGMANSFVNDGTINWSSGEISLSNGATFEIGAAGKLMVNASLPINGSGTVRNFGVIQITSGLQFNNTSTINETGGKIQGTGTVTNFNSFTNNGTVNPGASTPGQLGLTAFNNTNATLHIDIAGTGGVGAPNGHDRFFSTQAPAALGGTLEIQFTNGFVPSVGQFFEIGLFSTYSGSFSTVTFTPSLPLGLPYALYFNGGSMYLVFCETWYLDADADGFGNPAISLPACNNLPGYVNNALDCDDNNALISPRAIEICDGIDNNCNNMIDEGLAPNVSISGNLSFCADGNTTLTASGGNTYAWSNGGNQPSTTINQAGTYTVTVTGSGGCTATATTTVTQLALPNASISGNLTFCASGSTVLTATGGVLYAWSTGTNTASINVNAAGTYTVTATGANGCTASTTATVAQLPLPTPSIAGTLTFCVGGSTVLTASGGNTYHWSTGANTASATVNAAGTYTVTATATGGCTGTASVAVAQLPLPTPSISGVTNVCAGSSTALTATGGTAYAWSTGATTATITVNAAATYTVTATGANGCTATATATVAFNTPPNAQISGNTTICAGGTATLTATGGTSYAWSTGANTPSINTNVAGTYTATVTGANGCTATASATVTVSNLPFAVSVLGNLAFCAGNNTTLTASGGTSYVWSTGANTASIIVNAGGAYTVTATNNVGCTATAIAYVVVKPLPTPSIAASPNACAGASTLTASGGTSYTWNTGATTNSISSLSAGTYAVTATNQGGCTATATTNVLASPSISCPSSQTVCAGSTTLLSGVPTGGTYSGAGISGSNFNAGTAGIGTHVITYTVTGAGGCSASCTFTMTVVPGPDANITAASPVAANSTGNNASVANAGVGATYAWTIANGTITSGNGTNTIAYTAGASGSVALSVSVGAGGCTASANRSISIGNGPSMICPSGQTVGTDLNACIANLSLAHPAVTGPNPPLTLSVAFGNGSPAPSSLPTGGAVTPGGTTNYVFQSGQTQVTYTAMNGLGQTATCVLNIAVRDQQAPILTCPLTIVRGTDAGQCAAAVSYATPSSTDNCGAASASLLSGPASGATFPIGTTMVFWQANDAAGNLATCAFSVTVLDNQPPNITCPPNQSLSTHPGRCEAYALYNAPVASDNCGVPALTRISGLESGGPFPKGLNTIVWQARDAAGNTRTCSFRVIVSDNEAPAIFCPADISVNTTFGTCAAVVTYPMATFTDNCPGGTIARIGGLSSGSSFPVGVTPIPFRATDAGGRSSTCTLRVTVTDNQPPSMVCPGNLVATGSGMPCAAQVFYGTPTATDNCSGALTPFLFAGLGSGSSFPAGVTTNMWRAIDGNGLSTDCTFTVTVNCTNTAPRPNGQAALETTAQQRPTLHLAPNPATSSTTLTAEGLGEQGGDILVFDAMGRSVFQHPVLPAEATIRLDFGTAAFATGTYRVVLRTERAVVSKTLIIK